MVKHREGENLVGVRVGWLVGPFVTRECVVVLCCPSLHCSLVDDVLVGCPSAVHVQVRAQASHVRSYDQVKM